MAKLPTSDTTLSVDNATLHFYCSDSIELMKRLEPGTIDVIVTSPPYNLGINYRTYNDKQPRESYLAWTNSWLSLAARALHPKGSMFLNVGAKPSDPWIAMDVAQTARQHLHLQNVIHWIKSIAIDRSSTGASSGLTRDLALGHYKPINSDRFLNDCHELILHLTPSCRTPLERRAIGVPYQDQSNIGRWKNATGGLRCRGNTWFIPYETIQNRNRERPHPATFPPKLPEYCLRLHGLSRVNLALDPFLGLGNTAIACAQLGISCIGIDLDPEYLNEAVTRVKASLRSLPSDEKRPRVKTKATA